MSQVSQATIPLTTKVRATRRSLWLGSLLALAAIAAVVLILALEDESAKTVTAGTANVSAQPSVRTDGGPEESQVAASVGSRPAAGPDESRIAATVGGSSSPSSSPSSSEPYESRIPARITGP
jgi:hypothetical protein